ncbi:hypothetical protein BD414DRAFT_112581 [Trametes punicea]|nr:hypothetical protein BD414DRAFT_112581 [Trametes punicea]
MMREGPSSLRSVSSADPNEAMVASQQQHIADLVARNKTLEHTISKLKAAIQEEKERANDAVSQIQERWKAERAEWREGCDSLQIAHRIAHMRTADGLDRLRVALLEAKEALRMERLSRMQRDYRLVMFQAKELELEERNAQLERELEEATAEREEQVLELQEQAQQKAAVLEARCTELAEQLKEMAEKQANTLKEKEKAEEALSTLRTQHTTLLTASEQTTKRLERVSLQFESIKTSHEDLEKKYAESEATVASLRRQVEKWATLESRENADMENLRKARIELEVRVKQLETERDENEKQRSQRDALLEKLQRKVDKYKESWAAHSPPKRHKKTPSVFKRNCRRWRSVTTDSRPRYKPKSASSRKCRPNSERHRSRHVRRLLHLTSSQPGCQESLPRSVMSQRSWKTTTLLYKTHLPLHLRRRDEPDHLLPRKRRMTSKRLSRLPNLKPKAKARNVPMSRRMTPETTRMPRRLRPKRSSRKVKTKTSPRKRNSVKDSRRWKTMTATFKSWRPSRSRLTGRASVEPMRRSRTRIR